MPGPIHLKDKYRKLQEETVPELDVPALTAEIVGKLFDADTIQPFMSGRAEAIVFAVLSAVNTSRAIKAALASSRGREPQPNP